MARIKEDASRKGAKKNIIQTGLQDGQDIMVTDIEYYCPQMKMENTVLVSRYRVGNKLPILPTDCANR